MENTDLYALMFKRKSIRTYDPAPLDENTLKTVSAHWSRLTPLYEDIKIETKIVSAENVKGLFQVKSPHYLVILSEPKEGYLINGGFIGQQMDLFLSSIGLGCCWQGMVKPAKDIVPSSLEVVSVLAFGRPAGTLHRQSACEFKRKPLEDITDTVNCQDLLEGPRLAPSGVNSQPWFFSGNPDEIHLYCAKSNFIKAMFSNKLDKIDMGIALCHLWLSARHESRNFNFKVSEQKARETSPAGYYYIGTAVLK